LAGRADAGLVLHGIVNLMAMPVQLYFMQYQSGHAASG
jgi:hypothetical protein